MLTAMIEIKKYSPLKIANLSKGGDFVCSMAQH
jgi:hypothetical protein